MRVCVTPISPQTSKLDPNDKMTFKSISALKQWLVCTIFFAIIPFLCTDPLLEELLAYLPTRFHSHIFDYIVYEHSSDEESVHSTDSSASAFFSDDSTQFLKYFYIVLIFYATPRFLTQGRRHATYKRAAGRERPTTRKKGPRP